MSRITRDIEAWVPPLKRAGFEHTHQPSFWRQSGGWLPMFLLPAIVFILKNGTPAWVFMWALAFAFFFGCKWLTWWRCPLARRPRWRQWGYLLAWPGMDVKAFLDPGLKVPRPKLRDWIFAVIKTLFGALLVWKIARLATEPLLTGWIGLVGCVFVLHFGAFHLLALGWQQMGVDAQPIMRAPILSKSLAEFWGARWNAAFNLLVHKLVFQKLFRYLGTIGATLAVFLVSGIIHDLVISLPARAGYGFPTLYFLLQAIGLLFERRGLGGKLTRHHEFAGRILAMAVTAVPAFCLFHPPFIRNVILPMLHAIGAT